LIDPLTFLVRLLFQRLLNFDDLFVPSFFPRLVILLIGLFGLLELGLLDKHFADLKLKILEHAAQSGIDLAEVGEHEGDVGVVG